VINVDGNLSYPKVIGKLKKTGELGRRCRSRRVRYLNTSWMNMIRKRHVRWFKGDVAGQVQFVAAVLELVAAA
jgi:hypothetical protein